MWPCRAAGKGSTEFALEAVQQVRNQRADPNRKIVLIIDSVERLRGVGDAKDVHEVFKSAETLFSAHVDKLRFTALNVVYTVPPYLSALARALGSQYQRNIARIEARVSAPIEQA